MKASKWKRKWHKDLIRDDRREADMDEIRLNKLEGECGKQAIEGIN